jgi:hypothetical protein
VPADDFGMQIPSHKLGSAPDLYCGCTIIGQYGSVILSSYIAPRPGNQAYCAPIPYYYVKTELEI